MRAVAITGVGLITPAGLSLAETLARLDAGPLAPELPEGDEAKGLPDVVRLLVSASFKPANFLPKRRRKDLKLMARANRLALAAACMAIDDAGLGPLGDELAGLGDAGLFLGVGREPGNLRDIIPALVRSKGEDGRISLDRLIDEGMGWMNPLSSLKTLPNMSLAHVAIRLGAMGPNQTRCTGPEAGLDALAEAAWCVLEGRAPLAVAGAADTRVGFTDRLVAQRLDSPGPASEAGAMFVLEPLDAAVARGARIRAVLRLTGEAAGAVANGALGDCGAATGAVELLLAVARGEARTLGPVAVAPGVSGVAVGETPAAEGDDSGADSVSRVTIATPEATARHAVFQSAAPSIPSVPSGTGIDAADFESSAQSSAPMSSSAVRAADSKSAGRAEGFPSPSARRAPAIHRGEGDAVVITGVGLATPLGHDLDTFARRLLAGVCATGPIQAFDAARFPVRNACEVADFDPAKRLPAALVEATAGLDDRKVELALAAALDAARDHGALDPAAGIAYATGLSSVSVRELEEDYAPYLDADANVDFERFRRERAQARDAQSPRRHLVDRPVAMLRETLRLGGPGTCHFSACAAAAEAIGHAADRIRRGEVPMMLAGGADSMVHPFGMLPFILLGATTTEVDPERAGRPFDRDRDGFVMGEGGAFFVLEKRSRALAAGRTIYGRVLGWGSSCDAHNVTAPHPEGVGAERAMRAALCDAGLAVGEVDYINAHGTGTALNDVTEAGAIRRLFGEAAPPVSSSKAQIGHAIAAAGAVELLASLAAFRGGRLPPNPHLAVPDRAIDLDLVEPDGRAAEPRVILSNSFGFGGQNACLALGHPGGAR